MKSMVGPGVMASMTLAHEPIRTPCVVQPKGSGSGVDQWWREKKLPTLGQLRRGGPCGRSYVPSLGLISIDSVCEVGAVLEVREPELRDR